MILPRAALIGTLLANPALGQGLTCPKGQTASCLDRSTVCLDAMQCNSEGFTCKSQVSTCARDLSILQGKFDTLVRDYNALKQSSDQTLRENDLLRRAGAVVVFDKSGDANGGGEEDDVQSCSRGGEKTQK